MFQGHHGAALLISGMLSHPAPLPILFLLSQVQDLIFFYLAYVSGIEKMDYQNPPTNPINPFDLLHAPYSHGLFATILYALLAALLIPSKRGRLAAAICVASHWLLDFIVHEPDLDICYPFAKCAKVGLGLWRFLLPSILVESGLVLIGPGVYLAAIKQKDVRRRVMVRMIPLAAFMLLFTLRLPFAPLPPKLDSSITVNVYVSSAITAMAAWAIERPLQSQRKVD